MTELQQINERLDRIEKKLDHVPAFMKIPQASKYFGIGKAKIRQMCETGKLPAALIGEGKKRQVWLIPTNEAREKLLNPFKK